MMTTRRSLLAGAGALALAPVLSGCGFELRKAPNFAFDSIFIGGNERSSLILELKRAIAASGAVRVVEQRDLDKAQVILDVMTDQRERIVVGIGTAGQVREFQLRTRFKFRLRTPATVDLIPATELLQQRDISYSESAALSKEAEEALLYRDMQSDLVQQTMRRLAAVKDLKG